MRLLSIFLLALGLLGCEKTSTHPGDRICTTIGCLNGLTVRLEPALTRAGQYKIAVTADGQATTCTGSLPLPACEQQAVTCTGPLAAQLTASGCALPQAQHSFPELHLTGTPAQVQVSIQRDGAVVAEKTLTPAYKTSQPNGPDCEPICTSASEVIPIP